jgi:hypothetical protein
MARRTTPIERADLIGGWRLVAYDHVDATGHRRPAAAWFDGIVVFEPSGYLTVVINRDAPKDRPQDGTIAYGARYRVVGNTIRNEVRVASVRHWIGTVLERTAVLEGNRIRFTTLPSASGHYELLWERL